jgi:hypothetical protein
MPDASTDGEFRQRHRMHSRAEYASDGKGPRFAKRDVTPQIRHNRPRRFPPKQPRRPGAMSDYEYDIFISYRRMDEDWIRWTRENFVRPLRSLLRPALGNVQVFCDEQIETGMCWPDYLARAHARSRLLVPLLSRDYFDSPWCRLELALMHYRELQLGLRGSANPAALILPFIIDDGQHFPPEVQAMQGEKIHDYANPWIRTDSPTFQEFAQRLKSCSPRMEAARNAVPAYDAAWETVAHAQFNQTFLIEVQAQQTLPSLSLHNPPSPP